MDLNTGTPIPPFSNQMPPAPQNSPGLPDLPIASAPTPVTPTPVASSFVSPAPSNSGLPPLPPVSQTPISTDATPTGQTPAFTDTLDALKKLTDQPLPDLPSVTTAPPPPVAPPVPSAAPPTAPVFSEPVSAELPKPQMPSLPDSILASPKPVGNIAINGPYETRALLDLVVSKDASDLHLVVGYPPMIRIDGDLVTVGNTVLTPAMAKELIYAVLPDDKKEQLEVNREVDLAYQHETAGRFRINAYWQRGYLSGAFRLIPTRIRSMEELKLPELFHKFPDMEQGLVLVTGPTGHGKSTTLAAIIQEINMRHPKHILTIEDPIEYVFPQQKALVSQRELGDDTHSWKGALRSALREDPDVVLVGEMRDLETISSAITVAETGHLVFATLHTNNAAQTIQRIVNMYPDVQQDEIRSELADVLEVVVAQRLVPIKGGGRRAAMELMLMTPAIRNLIRENKIYPD